MKQDDVIRTSPPICALDFGVPAEFAERAESYARWAVAQEREKRTGTQEFVTLPREVVEQAMDALDLIGMTGWVERKEVARETLRAALDQPQNHIEQHLGMVPAGWKLVPVEPTDDMLYDIQEFSHILPPRGKRIWAHMLDAAPQPPAVEQPQANQPAMTPIAQRKLEDLMASGYTISGYSVYHEQKHQHGFVTGAGLVGWWRPEGMEYPQPLGEREPDAWMHSEGKAQPLYLHQQPKREPLTDEQIGALARNVPSGYNGFAQQALYDFRAFARAIEAAHNIK